MPGQSGQPRVAIVLLNWNGLAHTRLCMQSLRAVTTPHHTFLVDNGSRGNEADVLEAEFPEATVLRNQRNLGFTGGVNRGLREVLAGAYDYALLLNNDCEVDANFLEGLVAAADADPRLGLVGPTVTYADGQTIWSRGGHALTWLGLVKHVAKGKPLEEAAPPGPTDYVPGACVLIPRRVLEEVGLLDDAYFAYYDDLDYAYRVRAAGYRIEILGEATVRHDKSAAAGKAGSSRFSPIQGYLQGRNGVLFARRCLTGRAKATFILGQFTFRLAHVALLATSLTTVSNYVAGLIDGLRVSDGDRGPPAGRLARLGLA